MLINFFSLGDYILASRDLKKWNFCVMQPKTVLKNSSEGDVPTWEQRED